MPLRRRVQLLFFALFLVIVVGVALDVTVEQGRSSVVDDIEERLVPARDELQALLAALVDQETGQRGFLLTGDDVFLEPYRIGAERAETALLRLQALLDDDRVASAGVERVRSRVSAWQQLAADFEIDTKRTGREEVVTALVASGTGRRLFDQVRTEIDGLAEILDDELIERQERAQSLRELLGALRIGSIVVALGLLALGGRLLRRWITLPLDELGAAVRNAASGALRTPIPASGPPELVELGNDVDAMRRRLLAEVDDAARARAALADRGMIVVTLREDLAPATVALPPGVQLAGRFRPAKGLVAGDWYDVRRLDDDRIAFALVDVSGHGAEVATFALRTKALTMAAIGEHDPGAAFEWVASHLGETGELFLTGIIVEVSASSGRLRYASAGHPPLLLAGVTGVSELAPTGPLLGPLRGGWETGEATLERGGVLVAYSDGLVEPRDDQGSMFGVERLAQVLVQHQLSGVHAVADAALQAVEQFAVADGADDITLCVLGR